MQWQKYGLIWSPSGKADWARTHATLPVVQAISENKWWIYVSTRDERGKSRIGRLTVDVSDISSGHLPRVLHFDATPVLSLGERETFDDSGVMPSWIVADGDTLRLYYIGWNVRSTVPYHLSIGLAISKDGGETFRRYSQGPIVDRSLKEPFFVTAPCVHKENDLWRMWYVSCTGWREIVGRWEPCYHVKYAESDDGISWNITGVSCIEAAEGDAVGRPCVFRNGAGYSMLYSYRSITDYRTDRERGYRLGYAESTDGLHWRRMEDRVGVARSESGWDSEMIEYCWVQSHGGQMYLLYNGNGFGYSGVGMARLIEW